MDEAASRIKSERDINSGAHCETRGGAFSLAGVPEAAKPRVKIERIVVA
jgi:hypothetical protein